MLTNKTIRIVGKSSFITKGLEDYFGVANKVTAIPHDGLLYADKAEILINVACPPSPPADLRVAEQILMANSFLMVEMLDYCARNGSMMIHLSSGEAKNYREAGHPHSYYSAGKHFAEVLCRLYADYHNVDVRVARLYNVYGKGMCLSYPRSQSTFINDAINRNQIDVVGKAQMKRCYTHIDDVVRGIETIIEKGRRGEIYDLSEDRAMTISAFADEVGRISGKQVVHSGDTIQGSDYLPNTQKIKDLGWVSNVSLEDGLKRTICPQ